MTTTTLDKIFRMGELVNDELLKKHEYKHISDYNHMHIYAKGNDRILCQPSETGYVVVVRYDFRIKQTGTENGR